MKVGLLPSVRLCPLATPCLLQTLSSPLSGILGDRYDRILVLSTGAFIWAVMTSAMAFTVTLHQVRPSTVHSLSPTQPHDTNPHTHWAECRRGVTLHPRAKPSNFGLDLVHAGLAHTSP